MKYALEMNMVLLNHKNQYQISRLTETTVQEREEAPEKAGLPHH